MEGLNGLKDCRGSSKEDMSVEVKDAGRGHTGGKISQVDRG